MDLDPNQEDRFQAVNKIREKYTRSSLTLCPSEKKHSEINSRAEGSNNISDKNSVVKSQEFLSPVASLPNLVTGSAQNMHKKLPELNLPPHIHNPTHERNLGNHRSQEPYHSESQLKTESTCITSHDNYNNNIQMNKNGKIHNDKMQCCKVLSERYEDLLLHRRTHVIVEIGKKKKNFRASGNHRNADQFTQRKEPVCETGAGSGENKQLRTLSTSKLQCKSKASLHLLRDTMENKEIPKKQLTARLNMVADSQPKQCNGWVHPVQHVSPVAISKKTNESSKDVNCIHPNPNINKNSSPRASLKTFSPSPHNVMNNGEKYFTQNKEENESENYNFICNSKRKGGDMQNVEKNGNKEIKEVLKNKYRPMKHRNIYIRDNLRSKKSEKALPPPTTQKEADTKQVSKNEISELDLSIIERNEIEDDPEIQEFVNLILK